MDGRRERVRFCSPGIGFQFSCCFPNGACGILLLVSQMNQGTLYPVLLRLENEDAISSDWGPSENNRRARFYQLTPAGQKLLNAEKRDWEQTAAIIARFFEVKAEDLA